MVFNLCLNYLQNTHDAEEVTQDVFMKVHSKMAGFKGTSELRTWIYRITINQCLDFLKRKKRHKRFGFHVFIQTDVREDSAVFSTFDHPGIQLENKEATERIFRCMNRLPERQKTVLLLKTLEDLSQKEIAEVMDQSVKAIESLLSRAKANLRIELDRSEGL
jgi:RNA polymerase sigma factor (sigma-70 family)